MMIKKYLSYLFPIKHKIYPSKVSEQLEVTWLNGELVVDTKRANYSYGSLQKILRKGLSYIGYDKVKKKKNVLVLGVGGGSVIKTLIEEINYTGKIVGIELDPVMIGIAYRFFGLNDYPQVRIVQADAFAFVKEEHSAYDLIIIDLFQDVLMPDFLYDPLFIKSLQNQLAPQGHLLLNTIVLNDKIAEQNTAFCNYFHAHQFEIKRYPQVDDKNELILIFNTHQP